MLTIERINYKGNPNIGVYIFATDKFVIVPPDADDKIIKVISKILQVPIIKVSIADTNLIGIFVVGNNKGLLLPKIIKDYEYEIIKENIREKGVDINVAIAKTKFTALGNVCLVNDFAAFVHPEIYSDLKSLIRDVLEVEVVEKGVIAGFSTVGSVAFVNNFAGVVHPEASDNEIKFLSQLFRVPFDVGTVNFGVGFIKSGLVGNSKGILVGDRTTGPEILRLSKIFRVLNQ